MQLNLSVTGKSAVFSEVKNYLSQLSLDIIKSDPSRPWGGFFVVNERQAEDFRRLFFPESVLPTPPKGGRLSPKVLIVESGKRLSWQYHDRRAEIWRVIFGDVGVVTSGSDVEGEMRKRTAGEIINLGQGERHRLIGLDGWGVVAEIWLHTDAARPSDEEDIIRLQDDFGR